MLELRTDHEGRRPRRPAPAAGEDLWGVIARADDVGPFDDETPTAT